jgi:hypothetical protein
MGRLPEPLRRPIIRLNAHLCMLGARALLQQSSSCCLPKPLAKQHYKHALQAADVDAFSNAIGVQERCWICC